MGSIGQTLGLSRMSLVCFGETMGLYISSGNINMSRDVDLKHKHGVGVERDAKLQAPRQNQEPE